MVVEHPTTHSGSAECKDQSHSWFGDNHFEPKLHTHDWHMLESVKHESDKLAEVNGHYFSQDVIRATKYICLTCHRVKEV